MMVSAYDSVPLITPKEIRLVTILAGDPGDDIHCNLEVVRLKTAVKYSALSYRWGDPKITVPVTVQGQPFQVTANLAAALRQFRTPKTNQVMWIDALCINQHDRNERSAQVSIMGSIYREACFVIVWLGKEAGGSLRAMEFLSNLNKQIHSDKHIYDTRKEPSLFSGVWKQIPTGRWIFEALTADLQICEDLRQLFSREYWKRAWVMQEICLAKTITLSCGDYQIENFVLDKAIDFLHRVQVDLPPGCPRLPESPFGMANSSIWVKSGLCTSIYRLLIMGQSLLAEDPRDKIYSVLGLVNDPEMPPFQVDYMKTPEMVYKEMAVSLMARKDRDFLSLVLSRPRPVEETRLCLPSWTPQWSTERPIPLLSGSHDKVVFRAAGSTVASYNFDEMLDTLMINGYHFDAIKKLSGCLPALALPPANGSIIPRDWSTFVQDFIHDDGPDPHIQKPNKIAALSRTVIADRSYDDASGSQRATAAFYEDLHNVVYDAPFNTPAGIRGKYCRSIVFRTTHGRQLFVSQKGYLGLGPADAKEGDILCILLGVRVPLVLRQERNHYTIIGDCYVDGVMDGELIEAMEAGKPKAEPIYIR